MDHCPFCQKISRDEYDDSLRGVVTFEPLNPVTKGHRLFLPDSHITWNQPEAAEAAARCVMMATMWVNARTDFNLITSRGPLATQTVQHIHIHLVPRYEADGLHLPWTGQVVE